MKRNLLGIAAATLLLNACSTDETMDSIDNSRDIKFTASIRSTSRAFNEVGSEGMLSAFNNGFNVTAAFNGQNYFSDIPFVLSGNNWIADNSMHFPWPSKAGTLKFFAYSPGSLKEYASVESGNFKLTGYKCPIDFEEQKDLLYATQSVTSSGQFTDRNAALDFYHLLSDLKFSINSHNEAFLVKIKGIKLGNLYTTATFDPAGKDPVPGSDIWKDHKDMGSYARIFDEPRTLSLRDGLHENGPEGFLILPQKNIEIWGENRLDRGAYIGILCNISTKGSSGEWHQIFPVPDGSGIEKYSWTGAKFPLTELQAGTRYNIHISMIEGKYWNEAGIILPDQSNPLDPNDPTIQKEPYPGENYAGQCVLGGPLDIKTSVASTLSWYGNNDPECNITLK